MGTASAQMYYLLVYYGEAVDEFIDSKSGARIDAKTGGILCWIACSMTMCSLNTRINRS